MTDSTLHSAAPDVTALGSAIERRDAESILNWYAEDATLTVFDQDHPPAAPARYRGRSEIGAYYRDVCGRNINHQVVHAIATATGLAYTQQCTYPDGTGVLCSTVAVVHEGKIKQQNAVQVWDC